LYPGDIILTGTPEGVAPIKPGDVMDCRITGIDSMSVVVRYPTTAPFYGTGQQV
jgi:2-keto-4-pentenoate hydratase/2-oxohepta-3-ene-1,7-dioic acid hydratase in catechol pathway